MRYARRHTRSTNQRFCCGMDFEKWLLFWQFSWLRANAHDPESIKPGFPRSASTLDSSANKIGNSCLALAASCIFSHIRSERANKIRIFFYHTRSRGLIHTVSYQLTVGWFRNTLNTSNANIIQVQAKSTNSIRLSRSRYLSTSALRIRRQPRVVLSIHTHSLHTWRSVISRWYRRPIVSRLCCIYNQCNQNT